MTHRRIRLSHWNAGEARDRANALRDLGCAVNADPLTGPGSLREIVTRPPDARFVIDLKRLPSHGRDVALGFRTRRKRAPVVPLDDEAAGRDMADVLTDERAPSALDRAVRLDFRRDLDAALATLRPEFRRLVVMRYLEDMSYEDIAEVVGLPLGTVKSHLHRERAALGKLLIEAGWGPESGGLG